jgi:hypothetical protein
MGCALAVLSKVLDAFRGDFTFRERVARGRGLPPPHLAMRRRAALRAGFGDPRAGRCVPGFPRSFGEAEISREKVDS